MDKDQKSEYNKAYYHKNLENIKQKYHIPIECEFCKKMISKKNMKVHQKSNYCQREY